MKSPEKKTSVGSRLSMRSRRAISGYLFILPFIIGFLAFTVSPLVMSLQMSFSQVNSSTIQPSNFRMISYFGYDGNVEISKEIDLPENLRYNEAKLQETPVRYVVEPVDEVLTLRSDFAYGPQVTLSDKIELPNTVWYNPDDLRAGVYTVEPLKTAFEMTSSTNLGAAVTLSREVELPKGLQYNALQKENGVYVVEQINSIISLKATDSLGKTVTLSQEIELPEGYVYDEAQLADGKYVAMMADGSDIPVSFAAVLFDSGLTDSLASAYAAVKGGATPKLTKTCEYDKALFEKTGDFVVKLAVPVSFAKHLLDAEQYDLFTEVAAAVQGVTVEELGLPAIFTYDKALYTSKSTLRVQVADAEANVPNSFAVYLIANGHVDMFYETTQAVANSETVCALYQPVQDESGAYTAVNVALPTDVTYDESAFNSSGVISLKLDTPVVPFSFAGHIISNGGFGMFLKTIPDLLGLENYVHALTVDPTYNQLLVDEISKMAIHTIAILVVSFVIAVLLNQEFKGRAFVRAVFFLPVILSSGVLVNLETNNTLLQGMQEMISEETPFTVTDTMMEILRLTGLGGDLLDVVFDLIAEVYDIVMASGIQIIVFLSGLQNVPASLYEAADVEGCTKWEAFWMITFPMVSPLLIVNIIYTIIDFFTKMGGDLSLLLDRKLLDLQYDHMSAMSWIYFLVTLALIGVSALIVSKVVATDE